MKIDIRRWWRRLYLRMARTKDAPEKIALGFSIGVALGILPTFGLGILLALVFSFLFKANKFAAVLGSMIMNPWIAPLFWTLSYMVGSMVLGNNWYQTWLDLKAFRLKEIPLSEIIGKEILWPYLLGNIIIAGLFSLIFYFLILEAVRTYRIAKAKRLERKRRKGEV